MLFNSTDFAYFLPIVFALYWSVCQRSLQLQNILLLLASYYFYGCWDWRFLTLIALSTVVDFVVGHEMHRSQDERIRNRLLWLSIAVNLGLLGFFKYYNFFVSNFVEAFSFFGQDIPIGTLDIVLPVGISFYTFQTMSYTLDIWKRKLQPTNDFIAFAAFVSFFPQLVAGPIERASNFLPQILKRRSFSYPNAIAGCRLILYGLFKKVVISDNIATLVKIIFEMDAGYSGLMNVLGMLLFAVQIYCDFSGYSDIAIGAAKLFNIDLMTNFRRPYFANSLREFWARWHISLSTWFRDYVYIPLGGSKLGSFKTYRNLFITFLVSGFWHGANWTFLIWGAIHGMFLMVERAIGGKQLTPLAGLNWLVTMLIVMLSWVFFRAENIGHALSFIGDMFSNGESFLAQLHALIAANSEVTFGAFIIMMGLTAFFFLFEFIIERKWFLGIFNKYAPLRMAAYVLMAMAICVFGAFRERVDFIYFQF